MTKMQRLLAKLHGTPEQFEAAIWRAHDNLVISVEEGCYAINCYNKEWQAAGTKTRCKPKDLKWQPEHISSGAYHICRMGDYEYAVALSYDDGRSENIAFCKSLEEAQIACQVHHWRKALWGEAFSQSFRVDQPS